MRELPSFDQFNESIKTANINEGVFHRLPKNIISDELYLTSKNLQNFYDRTAAGNDVDPGVIDTIIRGLDKVKKAIKRFNTKEDVLGTVYEGEVLLYDELGSTIDDLRSKISNLMKSTTNKKWSTALGQALSTLSTLDRNLSQHDAKLGSIVTESDINEAETVKSEAISRLADFFRISPYALSKFNFDGKDNIKELTKVLNSTSDQGTELYYNTAIKAAKKDLGIKESIVNEGDMTKFYDGFKVLNDKTGKMTKFLYVKGRKNTDVENEAIAKLMKATGLTRGYFGVHGFVNKGEWNKDETPVLESEVNEASTLSMKEKQLHGELSQVVFSYKNLKKDEKVNAVKALIPRIESGDLSESELVNEASVQVAGNAKPSGAQVLATVIVDHLITRDFLKPGIDKMKKDVIKDIQKVIMDSTF